MSNHDLFMIHASKRPDRAPKQSGDGYFCTIRRPIDEPLAQAAQPAEF